MRTVALCEIEAFAIANLVAKMEAGLMDPAPIWTDLKTFPWDSFRGRVDILTGGYPCQPFSSAGKRAGADDPRHLWPFIADGIRRMAPRVCFFENVEGHITLGLREVIAELEKLGYQTAWEIFSAAECGAAHQRRRVFLLANSMCQRGQLSLKWEQSAEQMPRSESEAWRAWRSWTAKPGVCRNNDGGSDWVDRLRLLGNGVVPATAEKAFLTLINEIQKTTTTTSQLG
jgi:site-specific DNA-cytosine methylase